MLRKLDIVCVHYVPGEGEEISRLCGLFSTDPFDPENLAPAVGYQIIYHYQQVLQTDKFYLAENGEVYPQIRAEVVA